MGAGLPLQHLLHHRQHVWLLQVLPKLLLGHPHVLAVPAAAAQRGHALYELAPACTAGRTRGKGSSRRGWEQARQAGSERVQRPV